METTAWETNSPEVINNTTSEESIISYVDDISKKVFNNYCDCKLPTIKTECVNKIDSIFSEINDIYDNREQYNLHWAFENAQSKTNKYIEGILENQLIPELENSKIGNKVSSEVSKIHKIKNYAKKQLRLFSYLSSVVTVVEMIISLIIVITISKLSHTGESFISSAFLSTLFIGIVALIKVTLESYVVRPVIEKWGWNLYNKAIDTCKKNIAMLIIMTKVIKELETNENDSSRIISVVKNSTGELIEY